MRRFLCEVVPIERHEDVLGRFMSWHRQLEAVRDDPLVTLEDTVESLDILMQRFGPMILKVKLH